MVASGKVNVKPPITHRSSLQTCVLNKTMIIHEIKFFPRFKLEETMKAFEAAKSGKDGAIKIMIKC